MGRQAKGVKNFLGLYVHVPFCATTCDFCAFYQKQPDRSAIKNYLKSIESEFLLYSDNFSIDTIFFGGGTPGLLLAKDLEVLCTGIKKRIKQDPVEWTVEMSPSTVKLDKLEMLKDLGVTRISMGVQSFQEKTLEGLGRMHSPKQVYRAYELIQSVGFPHVNLDLIFAIPGQTVAEWQADLDEGLRLDPGHLSTYCLTFEEDTKLYIKLSQGKIKRDLEQETRLYEFTWDYLNARGYGQYEISNFAKKGHECTHNIHTWQMHDWIGIGPAASSQYNKKRYTNIHSIENWTQGIENAQPIRQDEVDLTVDDLVLDAFVFGLRMNAGVHLTELQSRFPDYDWAAFDKELKAGGVFQQLVEEGYLIVHEESGQLITKLTHEGRLRVDAVGSYLIECL